MECRYQRKGGRGFFHALGDDTDVLLGAFCMMLGMDPYIVIDRGKDDYLILNVMLRKAMELRKTEQQNLAILVGNRVAEVIGQIF